MKRTFLLILFLFTFHAWSKVQKLCPTIIVHGAELKLNDTEKRLVCGDKDLEAYRDIPPYQMSYFFQGFLQSRGYLNPEFKRVGEVLHVYPNKRTFLRKLQVAAPPGQSLNEIKKILLRLYRKKLLNTQLLNSLEAEALSLLRQRGHACAKVKSQVNTINGRVTIELSQLHEFKFGEISKEPIKGLKDRALERYYPFDSDAVFNEDLLRLTEKRLLRSEVVQGTYFLEDCKLDPPDLKLSQQFIIGPPRTLRFGAGASTEAGPMARLRWSHSRYRSMASLLSANLQASLRVQSIILSSDNFFWKNKPRQSLLGQIELVRESQFDYEQLIFRTRPHMKWTSDKGNYFKQYTLGPSYETGTYFAQENSDTKIFSTGVLEGTLLWMSHSYELFDLHPQEGEQIQFAFDYRHPALGFDDPLLKLDSSIVKLSRLTNSGRGAIIGGMRAQLGTTDVTDDVGLKGLPPTVKFFGGGSDDVRGFLLRTLPKNDGLGALTRAGLKLELRRTNLYKESLEAFSFVDGAVFGERSWHLESRVWYSPGLGMRWLSPIGLVQTYVARGYASKPYQDFGNFYFIGLGGTF
jgi:translocation and assembly module TamA